MTNQNSQKASNKNNDPPSKNRPTDSKWRQQKLIAFRPIYTPKIVLSVVFFAGFLFIPIGYFCLIASDSIKEWKVEYQNCSRIGGTCELNINLIQDFWGDVYFYYGLTNYHQSHRRYLRSWNSDQLMGDLGCTTHCSDPYKLANVSLGQAECGRDYIKAPGDSCNGKYWQKNHCVRPYAPCGAIANSFFTDVFQIHNSEGQPLPWTYEGLLWDVELKRFKNPELLPGERQPIRSQKPLAWKKNPCELDPTNPLNNGFLNFDFIVWMNSAAFSSFQKPYRKLKREGRYVEGMPKGVYKLIIQNEYIVSPFKGRKFFIISTTAWLGNNRFFGLAFLIIGSLCLFAGLILTIIHRKNGHTLQQIAEIPRYANDKHD
ncbi:Transmembrane protein 30A [Aphelenchoides bicaudatus]|nr:Transmembrane protein 30A [Aphelenchoides bicaudatus]